jgi:hypothetical protein
VPFLGDNGDGDGRDVSVLIIASQTGQSLLSRIRRQQALLVVILRHCTICGDTGGIYSVRLLVRNADGVHRVWQVSHCLHPQFPRLPNRVPPPVSQARSAQTTSVPCVDCLTVSSCPSPAGAIRICSHIPFPSLKRRAACAPVSTKRQILRL